MVIDAPIRSDNVTQLPLRRPVRPEPESAPVRERPMTRSGFAGMMVLDLQIPGAQSLKDKRAPLRSVLQRLRDAGFSASEVDHHDKWQRAQVAVTIVGRGSSDVEHLLDQAQRVFESRPELLVSVRQRTVLAIDEYE